jgi:hypothetical protein
MCRKADMYTVEANSWTHATVITISIRNEAFT